MNNGFGDKIEISEWTTWLPYVATGIGRFGVNTVVPSGANENYIFYDVTVTLDSPIDGFFSRMHLSWSTKPPTAQATYQIQPMSFEEGALLHGPEIDCNGDIGWRANEKLPLQYCDLGLGVSYVQTALGITVDGFFGAETWDAVGRFQLKNQLSEFLVVGPETWLKLFPNQSALAGYDTDGDGLITPDEFGK